MGHNISFFILLAFAIIAVSCKKDILDEKPNSSIVVPKTLDDFQAILDNQLTVVWQPALGQLSSDEYYLENESYWLSSETSLERTAYIWDRDIFRESFQVDDWNLPFQAIFYCNVVLNGLDGLESGQRMSLRAKEIEGTARFCRAFNYSNLAMTFCKNYKASTAATELGLPLRTSANVDEIKMRSTLEDTYRFVFDDLYKSAKLISTKQPTAALNRPSLATVYALLARVSLMVGDYQKAKSYCDSSLANYSTLIDYNTLSKSSTTPFRGRSEELLLHSVMVTYRNCQTYRRAPFCLIDSSLYAMYDSKDLRKQIYFQKSNPDRINIRSLYQLTNIQPFSGLAVDEVYLIRAEAAVRLGDISGGVNDINTLLEKRYITGEYSKYSNVDKDSALKIIKSERRKELLYRGMRWYDLKRYNDMGETEVLKRSLAGVEYELMPNDPRYVFPIPPSEIKSSGIAQNER